MPISYSQPVDLECPACHRPFRAEAWMIIDAGERPELAEAIYEGTIHDVACPHCGQQGVIPAPLLYHDPARRRVLFAVPPDIPEEDWRAEAQGLLWMLIGALPEERRRPYLSAVQAEAGISGLALVLQRDRHEADADESAVEALSESLAAGEGELPILAQAIIALLDAQTPMELERVFDSYPFLLDEAMDNALSDLAAAAYQQGDEQSAEALNRSRAILEQLRSMLNEAGTQSVEEQPAAPQQIEISSHVEAPPPPPGWGRTLAALLDPDQQAGLEELRRHYPLLEDPYAPAWLRQEIARRRDVGNLAEVQLLDEWLRQMKEG
ncbi:MAG: hypothetical protein KatS3mg057_2865 [Herpetosiphonaceae bacterium]|nr:MAG: hypothetical protein KatS3mg057_2865 [Herpetosiphonaceae bacterium]